MARPLELTARPATLADLPAVTETISLAFHDDPTWRWAGRDGALGGGTSRGSSPCSRSSWGEFYPPASDISVTTMRRDAR